MSIFKFAAGSANYAAWNLSYASYSGNSFDVSAQDAIPIAVFFRSDGLKMYILGVLNSVTGLGRNVYEYDLSFPWDISTASYSQLFDVETQAPGPTSLFFKPDGSTMYVLCATGDDVNEYDLSSAWDISTASYVRNRSVAFQETGPTGLFFKPDGTKMYVVGIDGDEVNEYNLSTPWNISTTSYVQNFSVVAQETQPQDLFFKPDGTKMYIVGTIGDDVNEYDLGAPWDISTASYVQNFSVAAQDILPQGLFFKPDGRSMYIMGRNSKAVYQYSLS